MPHNDDFYGSTFRVFEPIHPGLQVEHGQNKGARIRPNQKTHVMQPIGNMVRGDKSGLNWEKIKKGKAQASNQSSEGENLEIANDPLIAENNAIADMAMEYYEAGEIEEWQYDELMIELDKMEYLSSNNLF